MFKLIIVDDEINIRNGLKRSIDWESISIDVVGTAENGIKALALIQSQPIDIVIADINMPKMDGITMLSRIMKVSPNTIVIFMSAYDQFSYAQQALKNGAFDYLLKPFAEEDLIDTVNRAIAQIQGHMHEENIIKQAKKEKQLRDLDTIINVVRGIAPFDPSIQNKIDMISNSSTTCTRFMGLIVYLSEKTLHDIEYIEQVLNEIFKPYQNTSISKLLLDVFEKEKLLLLSFNENDTVAVQNFCRSFIKALTRTMKNRQSAYPSFGISNIHTSIEKLQKIYLECSCAILEQKYKNVHVNSLPFSDIPSSHNKNDIMIEEFSSLMADSIKNLDRKKIYMILHDLSIQMCGNNNINNICDFNLYFSSSILLFIKSIIEEIDAICEKLDLFKQLSTRSSVITYYDNCLNALLKIYDYFTNVQPTSNHIVRQAIIYIHKNYSRQITLSNLSKELFVSTTYLSRLFKKETGLSYSKYLSEYRIKMSKKLLKSSKYKVFEVGIKVGYTDSQHFARVFKQIIGVTPSEYTNSYFI